MSAASAPVPVTSARIVDPETKQVEIIVEAPGDPLRLRRNAYSLGFLGFSLEERRDVVAWIKEHKDTEAVVRCIQDRLVTGVFDGEEERRAHIEAALQNNVRRLDELDRLLHTAKSRIVDAWQRVQMEERLRERERMLPAPVATCG
jgi:hypothetical protein